MPSLPSSPRRYDLAKNTRRVSMTKRNRRRRAEYQPTGRKPGRPRKYFFGTRRGNHLYQSDSRGGRTWVY